MVLSLNHTIEDSQSLNKNKLDTIKTISQYFLFFTPFNYDSIFPTDKYVSNI